MTDCTKGTMMPVATAPKPVPAAPNSAPTMAKPIRLLNRMPPCSTEVIAPWPSPMARDSSTETAVPIASAPQIAAAIRPSGNSARFSGDSAATIRDGRSTQ